MAEVYGLCGREGVRDVGLGPLVVVDRNRDSAPHGLLEDPEEVRLRFCLGWNLWDHLARKAEGGPVEELGRGGVGVFPPSCPDPE